MSTTQEWLDERATALTNAKNMVAAFPWPQRLRAEVSAFGVDELAVNLGK